MTDASCLNVRHATATRRPRTTRSQGAAAPRRRQPRRRCIIKSARDIMRKDKGLNGDLDRLPHAHLDHVPQVPRRHGADARGGGRPSPASASSPPSKPPTAGATGPREATASPATNCSPSSTRTKPSRPTARAAPASSPICAACAARDGERPARRDRHRLPRRGTTAWISGYLLRDVINKVNGIHFNSSRGDPHPRHLYEIHAARDARRRRRLRRVLHAAPGGAVHGRGHRPAPGRDRARPGLRHRRLSGGGLRAPRGAVQDRSRTSAHPAERALLRAARPSRCPTCWPDEPAAARPGAPSIAYGNTLRSTLTRDRRQATGWT